MAHEQRWPRFAAAAGEAGAASMLSFQLYVEKDNLGALNLYSYRPNAFDDESEQVGLMFASHAAVAFADAQKIDQLNHKAAPRDLIGQAKGILMERYNISSDRAFAVLVRVSQHNNRKLRDVAEELVSSRQLSDNITVVESLRLCGVLFSGHARSALAFDSIRRPHQPYWVRSAHGPSLTSRCVLRRYCKSLTPRRHVTAMTTRV